MAKWCVCTDCTLPITFFVISGVEDGGFDKQGGATALLVAKMLFVLAGSVVRTVGLTRLTSLLAGSAHVVQHPGENLQRIR